jgi:hypothetical protein
MVLPCFIEVSCKCTRNPEWLFSWNEPKITAEDLKRKFSIFIRERVWLQTLELNNLSSSQSQLHHVLFVWTWEICYTSQSLVSIQNGSEMYWRLWWSRVFVHKPHIVCGDSWVLVMENVAVWPCLLLFHLHHGVSTLRAETFSMFPAHSKCS